MSLRRVHDARVRKRARASGSESEACGAGGGLAWRAAAALARARASARGRPLTRAIPAPAARAGTIKRWGHRRGLMTHGSKSHREHGSTGPGSTPGRTFPGLKSAGHMGNVRRKARSMQVLKVDTERGALVVKGSVPGKVRPHARCGKEGGRGAAPRLRRPAPRGVGVGRAAHAASLATRRERGCCRPGAASERSALQLYTFLRAPLTLAPPRHPPSCRSAATSWRSRPPRSSAPTADLGVTGVAPDRMGPSLAPRAAAQRRPAAARRARRPGCRRRRPGGRPRGAAESRGPGALRAA